MHTRSNPSARYLELQQLYCVMHEEGQALSGVAPQITFQGISLLPQAARIKHLVERTGTRCILDYGSGKGLQYQLGQFEDPTGQVWPGIASYWGVDEIVCYDPCYSPFSSLPERWFDGVISTDVLEHCPEQDMSWIVDEIFGFAVKFVFANIACYPANKTLPNGENAHCTIKPVRWWHDILVAASSRHRGVTWEVWIESVDETPQGPRLVERRISNA